MNLRTVFRSIKRAGIFDSKLKRLLVIPLCITILLGTGFPNRAGATDYPLVLTFVNNSGFDAKDIHLLCIGSNQAGSAADDHFGYVDFTTKTFVETGSKSHFSLDVAKMTRTLKEIAEMSGTNTHTISIPPLVSGRLYFAFGDNFDKCGGFSASGPPNGAGNPVVYDKVEFDTWSNPNINITNVDFFGVSYYITVTDASTQKQVTRGFMGSRDAIFSAFKNIAGPDQNHGNTNIFGALIMTRSPKDGVDKLRVLAPKNAAYSDFNSSLSKAQQKSSHFFDQYVNDHCWKPGRKFSFYSKNYKASDPNSDKTIYYGKVSADGMTLYLYTDENYTKPYQVASLPRPSSSNFNFPDVLQWHKVDSTDSNMIDWGFLLGGQVGGSHQGAHWADDPVAMAITTSIVRGVMHYDDGCTKWTNPTYFYPGNSGISTAEYPIFYYGKLLHDLAIGNLAYALSYDDVFGTDPSVYFTGHPKVTLTFNPVKPLPSACTATLDSDFALYIPNLSLSDDLGKIIISFWGDFVYEFNSSYPDLIIFKLRSANIIDKPPASCKPSTISGNLNIHIPDLYTWGGAHIWVDLQYRPDISDDENNFVVTNFGQL